MNSTAAQAAKQMREGQGFHQQRTPLGGIADDGGCCAGETARVMDQLPPELSRFPPAGIGRVIANSRQPQPGRGRTIIGELSGCAGRLSIVPTIHRICPEPAPAVYGLWVLQRWGLRLAFRLYAIAIPLGIAAIFPIFRGSEFTASNTVFQLTFIGIDMLHDAATVRVFPPAIPLVTILAGVALQQIWPVAIDSFLPVPARYWVGGLIVVVAVLLLGLWSVVLLRKNGQSENPWKPITRIVQHGPFRITRNPMYLQMVVGCVGFAVLLANPWILLLTPLCALFLQRWAILPEEAYLERKFGPAYATYKHRVRRWI